MQSDPFLLPNRASNNIFFGVWSSGLLRRWSIKESRFGWSRRLSGECLSLLMRNISGFASFRFWLQTDAFCRIIFMFSDVTIGVKGILLAFISSYFDNFEPSTAGFMGKFQKNSFTDLFLSISMNHHYLSNYRRFPSKIASHPQRFFFPSTTSKQKQHDWHS